MRLEAGLELPVRARRWMQTNFLFTLAVVLMACVIWLPAGEARLPWALAADTLVALYLAQMGGAHLARLLDQHVPPVAGLGLMLGGVALCLMASPGVPGGWRSLLLLAALLWLLALEQLPSVARQWPLAWRRARSQQSRLLAVALVSVAVAVLTRHAQY